jgi:acetylornithine deacetylase/succinyl-diaminopimelate desuccinylase-like protein
MPQAAKLDHAELIRYVDEVWEREILPELDTYIRIPCKSPAFDKDWAQHGYIDQAVQQIEAWCRKRQVPELKVEVVRLPGRTPVILMETPATDPTLAEDTVLLYGHLDKQPEMVGWRDGFGPWIPVREGDKLYGRGGADDGYSAYASLLALEALHRQNGRRARCVVLIEGCEESGSFDLPFYIDALAERIGKVSLVICLDSGCGNYDQLWGTTSLRGMAAGTLKVEILTEGVHSGDASGVVPSSFRIARQLLSRIEDEATGRVLLKSAHVAIPDARVKQAQIAAQQLGDQVHAKFPFMPGAGPVGRELPELVLNRTWRPALSIIGGAGLPVPESAGNVLRPGTTLALSLRLPPTADAKAATAEMQQVLTRDPPYGAKVTATFEKSSSGWNAPTLAPWLEAATDAASRASFGKPAVWMGEGGSIPFMGMLGEKFPAAQFLITGVLGPHSNAHGPNEFLHVPTAKKVTACVVQVLAAHAVR